MSSGQFRVPEPFNESVRSYAPGSSERSDLADRVAALSASVTEIPMRIGSCDVSTADRRRVVKPHDHRHTLGEWSAGDASHSDAAIRAAAAAWPAWSETPFAGRAAIFLRAAELLSGPWRSTLNAATMLGQSKNVHQAEIDASCELADFFRFNVHFAQELYSEQPRSSPGVWNRVDYRPLEGFVLAITPFNFTAIGGNLPTAPALMGNTVVWKPASTALLSAHFTMQLLRAAGLPDGVVNMVTGDGVTLSGPAVHHRDLAGVHFTGSTQTFNQLWSAVGSRIGSYRGYPRLVGETGGKDFVFAHSSADVEALAPALIRGAFEYQGQKCSAASRAYIPASLWPRLREWLGDMLAKVRVGGVEDFGNFVNAVIDRPAFDRIRSAIDAARHSPDCELVFGGGCDDSVGWFVQPTVLRARRPDYPTMIEELFGPVLTVFVYNDGELDSALAACANDSPYGLTGAVFGQDRAAVADLTRALRHAAGNFYINDKPTGAVVGQQPFGGARASGTNDKAGSKLNLIRWVSPRTIKETFVPPTDWRYPFLG